MGSSLSFFRAAYELAAHVAVGVGRRFRNLFASDDEAEADRTQAPSEPREDTTPPKAPSEPREDTTTPNAPSEPREDYRFDEDSLATTPTTAEMMHPQSGLVLQSVVP